MIVPRRLPAGDDRLQEPRTVRLSHEGDKVEVPFDVHDVDHLPRVFPLIGVFQYVYQTTLFNRGDNTLEGDSSLINELLVLFRTPIEVRIHGQIVIQCVRFVNLSTPKIGSVVGERA